MQTLSQAEIDATGLFISYQMPADVAPNPDFASPARGLEWRPDYGKYPPELAAQVRRAVEEAIYD